MIRLRLYEIPPSGGVPEAFRDGKLDRRPRETFLFLLRENTEPPFRDEASVLVLNEIGRWELVEGEWYKLQHYFSLDIDCWAEISMPELLLWDKYSVTGLCIVHNSRHGIYTDLQFPLLRRDWELLDQMPFDILLGGNMEEGSFTECIREFPDFYLEIPAEELLLAHVWKQKWLRRMRLTPAGEILLKGRTIPLYKDGRGVYWAERETLCKF